MWRGCNIVGALGVVLMLLSGPAAAQVAQPAQPAEADQDAPLVGWADGEAAFEWVQNWVRGEDGVPADADLPDRAVTGLFGVYVTLRDSGRVLGRGQALRMDVKDAVDRVGPAVQLAPLLAAATREALKELRDKQMKRAVELKITDQDLLQQAIQNARGRLQVDIQLGHSLKTITVPGGAAEQAVFGTFAPGYHGLRLSGPLVGKASYAWPAIELSRNKSAPQQVHHLMSQQGYDADELSIVARADGPSLQRFEVIHMVRPGPAQPMRQLTRGNVILQQQVVDGRTIAGLAERVAQYLDQLLTTDARTGDDLAKGTYQPSLQRYAPQWADGLETSMLSYALTRHASICMDAEIAAQRMEERATRALRLTDRLARSATPQGLPPKHLTAAFCLMAYCETPVRLTPDQLIQRDRMGQALLALHDAEQGGYRVEVGSDKRLSRAQSAVVTAALAAYYKSTRSDSLASPVWDVLGDLMRANANTENAELVDLFWVTHALDSAGAILAEAQDDPAAGTETLAGWHAVLAGHLELLSDQQVRSRPILGPNDVLGGFILEPAAPGTPPEPTWRSALPTAMLAFGLREPGIIPTQEQFGPVLTAGLGARFLGQLIITTPSTYYLRDAGPTLGGVRRTLWDNTLYPRCSAIALLALAELQQTLIELEPGE